MVSSESKKRQTKKAKPVADAAVGSANDLIRDRIIDFRRVRAGSLLPHPKNWRTHPEQQKEALRGILAEVGYVDALLVRQTLDGLQLIDGHLRAETTPDTEVPVLVVDLDDSETAKVLATFDPLAAMAESNESALAELREHVETESEELKELLGTDDSDQPITQLPTLPPPKMSWVLIGIPTVRFGEIAEAIECISAIDGIIVESTANDG